MSQNFKSKILFWVLISSFFFFCCLKITQKPILATSCTPGEKEDCNQCGERICQEDGTWGPCQKKGTAGPCCSDDGNYKSSSEVCASQTRTQYKCDPNNECGNRVLKRKQKKVRYCPGDSDQCTGNWGPWQTISSSETQCGIWQKCENGSWTTTKLKCKCAGECLEGPKNPRYYDNPNYPTDPLNPETSQDPNNIFLPVKFDWDDVKGWKDDWKENGETKSCSQECVQSYNVRIENTSKGEYSTTTDQSEYNYRDDSEAGACLLKSNFTHKWYVKACCNSDGTNCGPEKGWSFTTKNSPEPIFPKDPDWNGENRAENIPPPYTSEEDPILNWCEDKSAKSYRLKFYILKDGSEFCHPRLKRDGSCNSLLVGQEWSKKEHKPILPSYFLDRTCYFTKNTAYQWQVTICEDSGGLRCGDFGQKWRFETSDDPLPVFALWSPPDGSTVGFPVNLVWSDPCGVNSFQYELYYKGGAKVDFGITSQSSFDITPKLNLDKEYQWRARPCSDFEGRECQNWSSWRFFKTTGQPPNLISPEGENIPIPTQFEWENVTGAKSYRLRVWGPNLDIEKIIPAPKTQKVNFWLYYPDLKQKKSYSWQVRTCAREEGKDCGIWSQSKNFTTFRLPPPPNFSPESGGTIFTYQKPYRLSWDSVAGANFYQYEVKYASRGPEEQIESCQNLVGQEIASGICQNNYALLPLECLGEYQWRLRACFDENCDAESGGNWSAFLSFTLSQKAPSQRGGLVPCGRNYIDPVWAERGWNTLEPCQIKHIFALLQAVISFFFWKLAPLILVLLVIATAAIYYFSIGGPGMAIDVKLVWRYIGIGYGIIFLAWLIVNILLGILGYKVEFFGRWWQIKF